MTRPGFRNQISLGNIVQIGAMLVAVSVAFAALQGSTAAQGVVLQDHEVRLRALEATGTTLARIDTRLEQIEKTLERLSR